MFYFKITSSSSLWRCSITVLHYFSSNYWQRISAKELKNLQSAKFLLHCFIFFWFLFLFVSEKVTQRELYCYFNVVQGQIMVLTVQYQRWFFLIVWKQWLIDFYYSFCIRIICLNKYISWWQPKLLDIFGCFAKRQYNLFFILLKFYV